MEKNLTRSSSPATDRPQLVHALQELLSLPDMPSASPHVVALDLETISVDLRLSPFERSAGFSQRKPEGVSQVHPWSSSPHARTCGVCPPKPEKKSWLI